MTCDVLDVFFADVYTRSSAGMALTVNPVFGRNWYGKPTHYNYTHSEDPSMSLNGGDALSWRLAVE
ncbi:MAG: hypothetical protein L0K41_08765 [Yaniella sp.]|nr:hypothetical protein [Yaniella sp.]MDN5731045.1 hypothetical protein [Yaniella sp.]MDN5815058.1 hypothetical protein [Yaniella sp.]MDN5817692.1 hypothetical protein [Yaniella sp.]MDN5838197.1 hypothetical protein [Yaniella sp.]MDN5890043.1 hypothetical protein [Yaniella sp.]